jgi:hypothetical protein
MMRLRQSRDYLRYGLVPEAAWAELRHRIASPVVRSWTEDPSALQGRRKIVDVLDIAGEISLLRVEASALQIF